jgi:hypothetical protein
VGIACGQLRGQLLAREEIVVLPGHLRTAHVPVRADVTARRGSAGAIRERSCVPELQVQTVGQPEGFDAVEEEPVPSKVGMPKLRAHIQVTPYSCSDRFDIEVHQHHLEEQKGAMGGPPSVNPRSLIWMRSD